MSSISNDSHTVIVGAGPAGLTAALELGKLGRRATVFEADDIVGGISRSVIFEGCRMDIGGHRFFTKVSEVEALWHEICGDDLLVRERMSRIFYNDRFFDYPLKPANALRGLGVTEAVRVVLSYLHAQLFPVHDESTFDAWVSNRFGRRLYEIFFKTYTEKVWGMPCEEISAAWAAQRIKNLNLVTALKNAFVGDGTRGGEVVASLIEQFLYPRLGPGMMWERCRDLAAAHGIDTHLRSRVTRVHHTAGRVVAVDVEESGGARRVECESVVSSMPVGSLVRAMDPAPPAEVLAAADGLSFRDFLIIGLIVDRAELFPDNWIYIHAPEVNVGRVQNFKNWSPEMVSDPSQSFIGLEYFVNRGDELWTMADEELLKLGAAEAEAIGLFRSDEVRSGTVVRMPRAYPVYDGEYEAHLDVIRNWLAGFDNLFTVGRNGQHRYNNQDHSMLAGLYAARNIDGADFDLWAINEDESFHEEVRTDEAAKPGVRDRLTPSRIDDGDVDQLLANAFATYDEVALGGAVGITASLALAVATLMPLLRADTSFVPMLSLLGNYLFGFEMSWPGLAVGMVEVGAIGFVLGWATAKLINAMVRVFERNLERRLAELTTLEALSGGRIERIT
ncbi:MAG: NAD(P)/FAD-dependent oxidoreductase [Thermoanaerobaculales bacterium]|jgi:protoporphyrinogen oxidase|nr:NAD(P)/FAD-dependent oxidoreductase [Thermoanaerobaculales bacterium]